MRFASTLIVAASMGIAAAAFAPSAKAGVVIGVSVPVAVVAAPVVPVTTLVAAPPAIYVDPCCYFGGYRHYYGYGYGYHGYVHGGFARGGYAHGGFHGGGRHR